MKPLCAMIGVTLLAMLSGGCASPWQRNFEPNPALAGRKFAPTDSVQVRTVESERLQEYAADEHKLRVQSTTAPEDLSPQEKQAAKDRLLETLQLKERGDQIEVLGWSEFAASEKLSPNDHRLQEFAGKIGADYVVVASDYAGKILRTVERPMTTYSHSYTTVTGRRGRGRTYLQSDTSTTWVPTQELEDQYFYTAVFLRKGRPGEMQE